MDSFQAMELIRKVEGVTGFDLQHARSVAIPISESLNLSEFYDALKQDADWLEQHYNDATRSLSALMTKIENEIGI